MNNFVRTSGVDGINTIRETLWKSIYSNFDNMNDLIQKVRGNFIPNTIMVDFDFNKMSFTISSKGRPFDEDVVKIRMSNAYKAFINDMHNKGSINIDDYNKCIGNIDNMFFITFNNKNNINIHL